MLGQLLHSLNPARRAPALESDTENLHTKDLLFPSSHVDGSHVNDCIGDLDLECPRDVRVLVAQGEAISLQSVLLFDSKLSTTPESPRPRHTRTGSRNESTAHHTRTASGPPRQYGRLPNIEPIPENSGRDVPALSTGAFTPSHQRTRSRRASMPTAANNEENVPMRQKESDEVVKIALECMFENTPTAYRGIGNKIHIVPLDPRSSENGHTVLSGNSIQASSARGSVVRRPSTLSSSYTPSDTLPHSPRLDSAVEDQPQVDNRRRTVLITRTFSVNWSEDDNPTTTEPAVALPTHAHGGLPSPSRPLRQTKKQALKPPMYAITLILHLPVASRDISPPPSRSGPGMRRKGSHTGYSSVGSSYDSKNNPGWITSDTVFSLDSGAISSDVDDRVDLIGQHWDVIVRALTALQVLVEEKILQQLKTMTKKGRDPKLLHLGLAHDNGLRAASDMACSRLIRGIIIPRVRTGQGRWGVWRDEARWLDKWAGGREKNAFFFHLITAFLGTHTEWLNVVGPKTYRRRHREQQRLTSTTEDLSIPSRTIIISQDKMAARRLIFLLAAFLPANHHSRGDASPLRPGTSASFGAYSESPPTRMPLSRHESLRRTINRRGKRSTSSQRVHGPRTPQSSNGLDTPDDKTETGTIRFAGEDGLIASRRSSESKYALPLTMADSDALSRKSSATTSATATPGNTIPIAHLVRKSSSEQHTSSTRPNTGDSFACDKLLNTLQRSTTSPPSSGGSQPPSRWGSLRSLWSGTTRRESSSGYSDNDEGLGIAGLRHSDRLQGKLQQMVDEAETERTRSVSPHHNSALHSPEMGPRTPEIHDPSLDDQSPAKSMPIDVPLKMTVNEQDGVIDVELPFPGWGSPLQSPQALESHSGSSFGSTEPSSLMSYGVREADHPMNVAGMLGRLHPDFELQAVPPYPELYNQIKAAMLMEPNPIIPRTFTSPEPVEEWLDVCTSLITDTSTYTVKRLRLRRLVRFLPPPSQPPSAPGPSFLKSQYGNPYSTAQLAAKPTEVTLEEKFEETKVTDMDSDLVFAIERVLSQNGTSSSAPSISSSRSSSRRGRTSSSLDPADRMDITAQEVPQNECKHLIIGALEQIATAVSRERQDTKKYGGARLRSLNHGVESTLREGVRKWFANVEKSKDAVEKSRRAEIAAEKAAVLESDVISTRTVRPRKYSIPLAPHEINTAVADGNSAGITSPVRPSRRTVAPASHDALEIRHAGTNQMAGRIIPTLKTKESDTTIRGQKSPPTLLGPAENEIGSGARSTERGIPTVVEEQSDDALTIRARRSTPTLVDTKKIWNDDTTTVIGRRTSPTLVQPPQSKSPQESRSPRERKSSAEKKKESVRQHEVHTHMQEAEQRDFASSPRQQHHHQQLTT